MIKSSPTNPTPDRACLFCAAFLTADRTAVRPTDLNRAKRIARGRHASDRQRINHIAHNAFAIRQCHRRGRGPYWNRFEKRRAGNRAAERACQLLIDKRGRRRNAPGICAEHAPDAVEAASRRLSEIDALAEMQIVDADAAAASGKPVLYEHRIGLKDPSVRT